MKLSRVDRQIRILALLLPTCLGLAMGGPATGGEPIAFVLVSDGGQVNIAPAGNRVAEKGWATWARDAAPRLKAAGITRMLLHNPGGIYWKGWIPDATNIYAGRVAAWDRGLDGREMWVDQWCLAEDAHIHWANRDDLRTAHGVFLAHGVTEIVYYVGSPLTLRDAVKEGPRCVEAFTALGPTASLAFDATGWPHEKKYQHIARSWKAGDDVCQWFEVLKKAGHKLYVEPRLHKDLAGCAPYVDGTIEQQSFADAHRNDPNVSAIQPAETIRQTVYNTLPGVDWPADVTPLLTFGHGFSTTFDPKSAAPWVRDWKSRH